MSAGREIRETKGNLPEEKWAKKYEGRPRRHLNQYGLLLVVLGTGDTLQPPPLDIPVPQAHPTVNCRAFVLGKNAEQTPRNDSTLCHPFAPLDVV